VARRVLTVAACVIALALPPLNAVAAARAKAVTKIVIGSTVVCKKWGSVQVQLKVTQSIVGGKMKVKILDVAWPVWPQHTVRSVFINQRALPLLKQEVLQLQSANLETISGATDITLAFKQSLQAALLAAKKTP
jgi:uncharacterized protein with FMN-binding domain